LTNKQASGKSEWWLGMGTEQRMAASGMSIRRNDRQVLTEAGSIAGGRSPNPERPAAGLGNPW